MWESYGLGVKDAMDDAANPASPLHRPGRKITLIHRAHQADLNAIVDTFKALPGSDRGLGESTLAFSFKYSQAHMHGSTAPRFIFQNGWYDSMPAGKQTWLTRASCARLWRRCMLWTGPGRHSSAVCTRGRPERLCCRSQGSSGSRSIALHYKADKRTVQAFSS